MKYKTALLIGRFQPPHFGHLYLIKKALKNAERLIIGIGSANIVDDNNPILIGDRIKMIKIIVEKEKINDKVIKIVPLDDFHDDKKWLKNVIAQVGKFDLVVGNNDWTNGILEKAGYKVLRCPYYKRYLYEGWRIRKLIRAHLSSRVPQSGTRDLWTERIPRYLIPNFKFLISNKIPNSKFQIPNFSHVVLGGSFDRFHKGHRAMIDKALEVGNNITIGVATEKLFKHKLLSQIIEPFSIRENNVKKYLEKKIANYKIIPFSDIYGTAATEKRFEAIIVSKETLENSLKVNEMRRSKGLRSLLIIVVNEVLADDGKRISSERIRVGEINREGKSYWGFGERPIPLSGRGSDPRIKKEELILPDNLREELRRPLGKVFKDEKSLLRSIDISKYVLMIAVGDIIVDSLIKSKINPDVKIVDFRSRRHPLQTTGPDSNSFPPVLATSGRLEKSLRAVGNPFFSSPVVNKQGTINLKSAEIIQQLIKKALYKHEKSWIVVDGEEDLLVLPAILFVPLGSLVLYGHWQLGIIAVEVTEEIKEKVIKIIKKFN